MNNTFFKITMSIILLMIIGTAVATLNAPNSFSRGTKTYLNYTDMMNETGLRNGSISNITWIGFTPEKINGILQSCPISAENNATLCYNQTTNNLTISYNGSIRYRILDNRTTVSSSGITQQFVETSNRAFATVYQNTNTSVRWILVTGGATQQEAFSDAANPPTTSIQVSYTASSGTLSIFPVLPNYYYKITGQTVAKWMEYS